MAEWHKVSAKIISQKGQCEVCHKVGDEFIIGDTLPSGMCTWAFFAMFPFITALESGGAFPWEPDKDKAKVICPDPGNPVTFELKRLP